MLIKDILNKQLNGDFGPNLLELLHTPKNEKTLEVIERAKKIHGDKYTYQYFIYTKYHDNSMVCCPIHGPFSIEVSHLLSGRGCRACGYLSKNHKNKVTDTASFIEKANEKWDNFYDYSKTVYKKTKEEVVVTCPIHGDFPVTPNDHLNNQGCPECAKERTLKSLRLSQEVCIDRINKIYNGKYDTSLVKYVNESTPIELICPEHGKFSAYPSDLFRGHSCRKCSTEANAANNLTDVNVFIERINEIFDGKYSFEKLEYKGRKKEVTLICPEHGEFTKTPDALYLGFGCPKCKGTIPSRNIIKMLDEHQVYYIMEYSPDWLRPLRADFYCSDYNCVIEANGGQHYFMVPLWGGEEGFQKRLKYDKMKKEICQAHGITVLNYSNVKNIPEGFDKVYDNHEDVFLAMKQNIKD